VRELNLRFAVLGFSQQLPFFKIGLTRIDDDIILELDNMRKDYIPTYNYDRKFLQNIAKDIEVRLKGGKTFASNLRHTESGDIVMSQTIFPKTDNIFALISISDSGTDSRPHFMTDCEEIFNKHIDDLFSYKWSFSQMGINMFSMDRINTDTLCSVATKVKDSTTNAVSTVSTVVRDKFSWDKFRKVYLELNKESINKQEKQ